VRTKITAARFNEWVIRYKLRINNSLKLMLYQHVQVSIHERLQQEAPEMKCHAQRTMNHQTPSLPSIMSSRQKFSSTIILVCRCLYSSHPPQIMPTQPSLEYSPICTNNISSPLLSFHLVLVFNRRAKSVRLVANQGDDHGVEIEEEHYQMKAELDERFLLRLN